MFYEWTTAEKITRDDSAIKKSVGVINEISENALRCSLRCNFWDLLHCDDRRAPWWASRDGLKHDCSRSDTVMISMKLTVMLVWLHFSLYVFCSVLLLNTKICVLYDCWLCSIFTTEHKLTIKLRVKTFLESDCPFRFLLEDFRLCSRYNNFNYGAWHVFKPLFGSSVATCSEISLSIYEKRLVCSTISRTSLYWLADGVTA